MLHYRFANSLENPEGFIVALNHVDERLGGSGQIGFTFNEILARKLEIKPDLDHISHGQDTAMVPEEGWARDQDSIDGDVSRSDPTQVRTRWNEIRAANSRSAGQSSWDTIRQRHERSRLPDPTGAPPSDRSPEADERGAARAKFDALLEAERRRGQSQGDRE